MNISNLTPDQLAVLHKLTTFKYEAKPENLITLEEYNSLPDYLKGYAYYFQHEWEESPIPEFPMDSDEFREGMQKAQIEEASSMI